MPYLIGSDEAGYGPNLGPLTVTGTLWNNQSGQACLYDALEEVIKSSPHQKPDNRLVVADSKVVYRSSGSIKNLETTVLSFLTAAVCRLSKERGTIPQIHCNSVPQSIEELVRLFCPQSEWRSLSTLPAYDFSAIKLPLKAEPNQICKNANHLVEKMEASKIELLSIECLPVFPTEFNAGLQSFGNKATLLSNRTLEIVSRLKAVTDDDLEIVCDKHGGRSKYASLIKAHLTDQPICTGEETKLCSDYSFSEQHGDVVVRFQAGGESFMPTALASMVSKYVREVFMEAWNQFWIQRIPNLKPTKGYPVDAKRFKLEIDELQSRLKIANDDVWRLK